MSANLRGLMNFTSGGFDGVYFIIDKDVIDLT